jgi:hypothetical protein
MAKLLAVVSFATLQVATQSATEPTPTRLTLVFLAMALAIAGSCLRWPVGVEAAARKIAWLGILALLAQLLVFTWSISQFSRLIGRSPAPVKACMPIVIALSATYFLRDRSWLRWRFPVILIASVVLGAWIITTWTTFKNDVWLLQQRGCMLLLDGRNPYSSVHPGIPWKPQFDAEVARSGRGLRSFPYPPLSLLMAIPGYLAGDVRWSLLLANSATAWFLVAAGRRSGSSSRHTAEVAAIAFLYSPYSWIVLDVAWTEPFLMLAISASLWATAARRRPSACLAIGCAIAVKQFGFFWLAPMWASGRIGLRSAVASVAIASLVTLPFVFWDPSGFWLGTYRYPSESPYRADSLSIPGVVLAATGYKLPGSLGFLVAALIAALVIRRSGPSLPRATLGGGAIYMAFFLFSRAGNLNYYWLAGSLLLASLAVSGEQTSSDVVPSPHDASEAT